VLSGLTASSTNEVFEVGFGGMITIPAAFIFLGATMTAEVVASGSSFALGFRTLPVVFAQMPAGEVIGGIWFFMLFLAAITSSLSMLQPVLAFFEEALGVTRAKAVLLLTLLSAAGSLFVIWFSKDLVALSTLDDWVGTLLIFVLATVQIICFGWVFGVDRGLNEAHVGAEMRIPSIFRFIIKYVAPLFLLVVFVAFCVQKLPGWASAAGEKPVALYTLGLVLAIIVFLVVVLRIGERRWRAMGLDLDGRDLGGSA
jgi:SNF family Na+-dependent transporter